MSSYIEFNSLKRQAAKTDFEKDFFKLLNNSVYGKFIESVRKRTNVEVVRDIKRAKKIFCPNKDKISDHLCDENCRNGHSATAKGVPRVAKQKIAHQDYKDVLLTSGTSMVSAQSIRTINNSLYSIKTTKRGLSAYDDKKYTLDDKISTLSYGHYKLV